MTDQLDRRGPHDSSGDSLRYAGAPDPAEAGRSGDPVELTRALIGIPSVNPELSAEGTGEAEIARICAGWLRAWGFSVEVIEARGVPGRPSVLARIGSGAPCTVLNGHLDTVGVEEMTIDPFDPLVRDGLLFGRGSCDMKAGLGAILATARRLASDASALPGELIIALTADEEHASIGLRELLDRGLAADRAIVTEPTSLALQVANKGFAWAEVAVHGRAAHGSRPELGRDAIRGAGRVLAALDAYEAEDARGEPHPLLGRGSIHAGTIRGGSTPSVYPAHCTLVLEARTLPGEGPDRVIRRLERLVAGIREGADAETADLTFEVTAGLDRPGSELAGDAPLVLELERACRAEGVEPRREGMSAWVESAWFNEAGIPALCFGPGSLSQAHTASEHVPIREIRLAAAALERFVRDGVRA